MDQILPFSFNEKSAVLLIFFFNGIVFSFLLLKRGFIESRQESKWLGLFVFLCSLYICPFMLGYAGWYSIKHYREVLFFIPFQQLFLIGPIIYIYTQSLLNKDFKFSKKHAFHFLPAIIYLVYSLVIFVTDKLILKEFYFYSDGRDKDLAFWYQMAGLLSMLFYLVLSLKYYRVYIRVIVDEVSFADEILFKWIRHFLIAFGLILLARVFFFVLNPEWGQFGSKYWYYLCFSILFFYIAISGYSNTIRTTISFDTDLPKNSSSTYMLSNPKTKVEDENYLQDLESWKKKIELLIEEEKIYTDPNLKLTDVALKLNTNRNIVSSIINKGFGMNFNDFINSKRVKAVIDQIKEGRHTTHTLLGLALECGFNSKATFNRAFKKNTSLTPKEYIAKKES